MVMKNTLKTSAVIIAAGFSSRMHVFKPLLTLGNQTVLERTISIFTQAGIRDIVVVLGHQSDSLKPLIESLGVKWVFNPNYEQGMFASVQTGVTDIDATSTCFFMMPVDMPLVKPETIKEMMAAYDDQAMDVLYPSCDGRRGHPPLISNRLIPQLIDSSDSGGLKVFLETQGKASYIAIQDPGILMDMDTETDYEKMRKALESFE